MKYTNLFASIWKNSIFVVILCFLVTVICADLLRVRETDAMMLGLPEPTQLLESTAEFSDPVLKGLRVNPDNPLEIDFIFDTANHKKISKKEGDRLVAYFLASLSLPAKDLWVNLSPYEADRKLPDSLAQTVLGRDLLGQDYILKQLSSSLTHPDTSLGEAYWKAFSTIDSRFSAKSNAFSKIWISPGETSLYAENNSVFIAKAELKIQSEEDYLARSRNSSSETTKNNPNLLIPKITDEINNGKHFAKLRQIYHSLVLGMWFKEQFKNTLYRNYINSSSINGFDDVEPQTIDKIYKLYCKAFEKGVYDILKRSPQTNVFAKKTRYFSGGFTMLDESSASAIYKTDAKRENIDFIGQPVLSSSLGVLGLDKVAKVILPIMLAVLLSACQQNLQKINLLDVELSDKAATVEQKMVEVVKTRAQVIQNYLTQNGIADLSIIKSDVENYIQKIKASYELDYFGQSSIDEIDNYGEAAWIYCLNTDADGFRKRFAKDQGFWTFVFDENPAIFYKYYYLLKDEVWATDYFSAIENEFYIDYTQIAQSKNGDKLNKLFDMLHKKGFFGQYVDQNDIEFQQSERRNILLLNSSAFVLQLLKDDLKALEFIADESPDFFIAGSAKLSESLFAQEVLEKLAIKFPKIAFNGYEYYKNLKCEEIILKASAFKTLMAYNTQAVDFAIVLDANLKHLRDRTWFNSFIEESIRQNAQIVMWLWPNLKAQGLPVSYYEKAILADPVYAVEEDLDFFGLLKSQDADIKLFLKLKKDFAQRRIINPNLNEDVFLFMDYFKAGKNFDDVNKYLKDPIKLFKVLSEISNRSELAKFSIQYKIQSLKDDILKHFKTVSSKQLKRELLAMETLDLFNILVHCGSMFDVQLYKATFDEFNSRIADNPYLNYQLIKNMDTNLYFDLINNLSRNDKLDDLISNFDAQTQYEFVRNHQTKINKYSLTSSVGDFGEFSLAFIDLLSCVRKEVLLQYLEDIKSSEDLSDSGNLWLLNMYRMNIKIFDGESLAATEIVDSDYWQSVALPMIQRMNYLHDESNSTRFRLLDRVKSPDVLFKFMCYGVEELDDIYSSSFSNLYSRLLNRMQEENVKPKELLEMNPGTFRVFISLLNRANKVDSFLKIADKDYVAKALTKFVSNLEDNYDFIDQAAIVCGTITDIRDPQLVSLFEELLYKEYIRGQQGDAVVEKLYGNMLTIFLKANGIDKPKYKELIIRFSSIDLSRFNVDDYFNSANAVVQRYYFYNDQDGRTSFNFMLGKYKNNENWKVIENSTYVEITSKNGRNVTLYMNKPGNEEAGNHDINQVFRTKKIKTTMLVHRGHSYHLKKTIDAALTEDLMFSYLGSCGGYGSIVNVLGTAKSSQILATRGTGTMYVNDVLLKRMNEKLRVGESFKWDEFWMEMDSWFKTNTSKEVYTKFKDYVPPHKNYAAMLVAALLVEEEVEPISSAVGGIDFADIGRGSDNTIDVISVLGRYQFLRFELGDFTPYKFETL